jgi:DNA-binding HxlR family transcriptional regulator
MEACSANRDGGKIAIQLLSRKWALEILYQIGSHQTVRFNELQRNVKGITKKVLNDRLKELIEHRIIMRKVYDEMPLRVEYSFTEHGGKLAPAIELLHLWGVEHLNQIMK